MKKKCILKTILQEWMKWQEIQQPQPSIAQILFTIWLYSASLRSATFDQPLEKTMPSIPRCGSKALTQKKK